MILSIRAGALAILLVGSPVAAAAPSASTFPILTGLVKAQIALEEGDLAAVLSALNDAYLHARVLVEKEGRSRVLDATMAVRRAASNASELVAIATGPAGACRVRQGFDGDACSAKANDALALLHAPGAVSLTSFDDQAKVNAVLIRAFGAVIEPVLKEAIAVAKEEGS